MQEPTGERVVLPTSERLVELADLYDSIATASHGIADLLRSQTKVTKLSEPELYRREISPGTVELLTEPVPAQLADLTFSELDVLGLIKLGYTNRQIANRLLISAETVKTHATHIYRRLGITGRFQANLIAEKADLLNWASRVSGSSNKKKSELMAGTKAALAEQEEKR